MAEPIRCDAHAGEHVATWLVVHLENGDSLGYCDAAYAELMTSTVAAMAQAEADQAAAEAEARLASVRAGSTDTDPAKVVKRGTSRSRRAHEARRRAIEAGRSPTLGESVAGPDDDEPDDADELAPEGAAAG